VGGHVEDTLMDEYLAKYIAELRRMYDERKAAAGFPDRELVVLKFPPTL
jgi:hypothetical protein